jgi:hypothetical protein
MRSILDTVAIPFGGRPPAGDSVNPPVVHIFAAD